MPSKPSRLNPLRRLFGQSEEFTFVAHSECHNCGEKVPQNSDTAVLVMRRKCEDDPYGWYSFCTTECYEELLEEFFPELWTEYAALKKMGHWKPNF